VQRLQLTRDFGEKRCRVHAVSIRVAARRFAFATTASALQAGSCREPRSRAG
jgi:hypothetical protein